VKKTISATALARQLGDVLGRLRYRGDSFIIERNGVAIAKLSPMKGGRRVTVADALSRWRDAAPPDPDFATALERIGAADRAPGDPWVS
jgi:antitoxin (DNA-binding transcriptional repressor) of toxin-antitoxin stability system